MASKPNSAVIASKIGEAVEQTVLINDLIRALQAKSQALMDECWEFARDAVPDEGLARTLFDSVRAIEEMRTQDDISEEARSRFRELLAGDEALRECLRDGVVPEGSSEAAVGGSRIEATPAASTPNPLSGTGEPAATAPSSAPVPASPPPVPSKPVAAVAPKKAKAEKVPPRPEPSVTEQDVAGLRSETARGHPVDDAVFDTFIATGRTGIFDVAGTSPYLIKESGAGLVFEFAVLSFRNGDPDPFDGTSARQWRKKISAAVYTKLAALVRDPASKARSASADVDQRAPEPEVEKASSATKARPAERPSPPAEKAQAASPPAPQAAPPGRPPVRRPVVPRPAMHGSPAPEPPSSRGDPVQSKSEPRPADTTSVRSVSPAQPESGASQDRVDAGSEKEAAPAVAAPAPRRGPVFGGLPSSGGGRPPGDEAQEAKARTSDPPPEPGDEATFGDEDGLAPGEAVPIELIAAQAASSGGRPRPMARGKPPPDPFE